MPFYYFYKKKSWIRWKSSEKNDLKRKNILLPKFAEFSGVRWASFRFDSMLYGFVHKFGGFTVLICFIIFYVPFYNSLQNRIPNRINANKCFYQKLSENFNRISKLFFSALFVNSIFFWSGSSSHHYFQ